MNVAPDPQGRDNPEEPFVPDFSEGAETGLYLALLELLDEGRSAFLRMRQPRRQGGAQECERQAEYASG